MVAGHSRRWCAWDEASLVGVRNRLMRHQNRFLQQAITAMVKMRMKMMNIGMMIVMMLMVNLPGFRSASWVVVKAGFEEDQGRFFQVSRHCWLLLVVILLRITIIIYYADHVICCMCHIYMHG